jgi:hypothetical protein
MIITDHSFVQLTTARFLAYENIVAQIQGPRVRRQELSLQRWEPHRAKGQRRFVLQQALTWFYFIS